MKIVKKIVKNAMPYYFAKKHLYRFSKDPFVPGGYYSPLPSMDEIKKFNFDAPLPENIPGIDLNSNEQLELLNSFETFYNELPFSDEKSADLRYYYNNDFYAYCDAIMLYCMIRHLKPKKIIEVGSGFSSSVTLDTNEIFMNNSIECVFIEPYPQRLISLLTDKDKKNVKIHQKRLQDIPLEIFEELKENDILFIDSTHVCKLNSYVNYIIHSILPVLSHGVHIHFHDVFYPFEYPKDWLYAGRAWNEQYILRAFLQYNNNFKIVFFNSYIQKMYEAEIKSRYPSLFKWRGASIWLKKI